MKGRLKQMKKEENKEERIGFSKQQMIDIIKIIEKHNDLFLDIDRDYTRLSEQLKHEKWKVKYLTLMLRIIAPSYAVSDEELNKVLKRKTN